jgi:hypothetical protein
MAVLFLFVINCSEMETKWARTFDALGPGNYRINDIDGTNHNIYLTGTYSVEDEAMCFVARYDKDGSLVWDKTHEGENIEQSRGKAILALRTQEELLETRIDIYVLVHALGFNGIQKAVLTKYDTLGGIQWQNMVTVSDSPFTSTLLSDYKGSIYVAGWEEGSEHRPTIYIAKYRASGEMAWYSEYYNEQILFRELRFDVVQPEHFVVAGILEETDQLFYLKYNSSGQMQRLTKYESTANTIADVKVDLQGNVCIAGSISNPEAGDDFLINMYDKDSNLRWSAQYDGEAHGDDRCKAISVDDSSNVYVTGSSEDAEKVPVIVAVKYDSAGNLIWAQDHKQIRPAEPLFMQPRYIHFSKKPETKQLFIAGYVADEALILRGNIHGNFSWSGRYVAPGKTRPTALSGNYMALECFEGGRSEARLVKYGPSTILGIARWD